MREESGIRQSTTTAITRRLERVHRYWDQPVNNPLMTESRLEAARKSHEDPVYVIKLKWMGRLFVFVGLAVWLVTLRGRHRGIVP